MAQLGERQTEDLKVPGSVPGLGMLCDALFKLVARHSAQLYPVRLLHGIAFMFWNLSSRSHSLHRHWARDVQLQKLPPPGIEPGSPA